ncbi:hypothetical protein Hamer_G000543, partial [Homarus americanus]
YVSIPEDSVIPQDPPEAEELLIDVLMPLRMRRIPPMFAPHLWKVHDATMNNNARTNNICEGWNNKFFNLVGHYHPSVWRVIEWFQLEEATVSTIIQQDGVGNPPRKRVRRRYVQLQERIRNLSLIFAKGKFVFEGKVEFEGKVVFEGKIVIEGRSCMLQGKAMLLGKVLLEGMIVIEGKVVFEEKSSFLLIWVEFYFVAKGKRK